MAKKSNKKVKVFQKKKKPIPEKKIIEALQAQYKNIDVAKTIKFSDLPLSSQTQRGLKDSNFIELTDIQKQSIGLALQGYDVLGAAKTGSGKTLAFLIPVIELLFCKQWTRLDGLGALIITPTRELAYQIFETLRTVGRYHDLSAALVIGGKDLRFETQRMDQCNILICTPGRLLHHMDNTTNFDCSSLQVLVLDEADRCLDLGFQKTMNAIIENLPTERQTLLFSATQTKSIKELGKLSLKEDAMFVSAHENSPESTPENLQQNYVICALEDKMTFLWSFVRTHLKHKVIVFFSSCKQVKFMYEAFCRMRPGVSLLCLYGKLHQLKRMNIYDTFCRKQHAVLFATDVVSRGLDFPEVDWVLQMDCPEDVTSYIHRAGRTARFTNGGESLLVLAPSEMNMIDQLHQHNIPISMIKIDPRKLQSPQRKLEALLAHDCNLKERAQKAFTVYLKSVSIMKDKKIFDVHALNTDAYASSLGLTIPPRIRFLKKTNELSDKVEEISKEKEKKNQPKELLKDEISSDAKLSSAENSEEQHSDGDDGEILSLKRKNIQIECSDDELEKTDEKVTKPKKVVTKTALAKKILKKKILPNKKTNFDEDGQEILDSARSKLSEQGRKYEQEEEESGINIEMAKQTLRLEDAFDKERYKTINKEKRREEKRKLKARMQAMNKGDITEKKNNKNDESDESEEDDLEGASDDESYESDSSYQLPDPDEIYGKVSVDVNDDHYDPSKYEKDDDDPQENSESEISEDERQIHRPHKRKLTASEVDKKSKKKRVGSQSVNILQADEELALQLLRN